MQINQEQIEVLFSLDDVIPCSDGIHLQITAILDDSIRFRASAAVSAEIILPYSELSDAIAASETQTHESSQSVPHCFAAEYRKRTEQARRDEEVDAMWRSAMVCQL